eukprot:Gb_06220 [translate_table: standard]
MNFEFSSPLLGSLSDIDLGLWAMVCGFAEEEIVFPRNSHNIKFLAMASQHQKILKATAALNLEGNHTQLLRQPMAPVTKDLDGTSVLAESKSSKWGGTLGYGS